jgi:hypothetical protein
MPLESCSFFLHPIKTIKAMVNTSFNFSISIVLRFCFFELLRF